MTQVYVVVWYTRHAVDDVYDVTLHATQAEVNGLQLYQPNYMFITFKVGMNGKWEVLLECWRSVETAQ